MGRLSGAHVMIMTNKERSDFIKACKQSQHASMSIKEKREFDRFCHAQEYFRNNPKGRT